MTLRLTINGEPHHYPDPMSVAALIEKLALSTQKIAIERNQEIVPRSLHSSTRLCDGDVIEIVEFIGGG